MLLEFYKLDKTVRAPERAHALDAGIDFFVPDSVRMCTVCPQHSVLLSSGLSVRVPAGYCLQLNNRSSLCLRSGLVLGACIIDSGFEGEIKFHLINVGRRSATIAGGMKLVQGLLLPVPQVEIEVCLDDMGEKISARGAGGFGSTGG